MSVTVRRLEETDATAWWAVRLRALRDHPEAFGASYEEDREIPIERVAEHLRSADNCILGGFVAGTLAGFARVSQEAGTKTRHKAHLGGMYVVSEARRLGVGRAIVATAIAHARELPHVEDLILAVTVGNTGARDLYLAAGFVPSHVEPRYLKVGKDYYDIEWMVLRLGETA